MTKLSIIIPIYGVEDYLAACLESVLLPAQEDYEIVCVDDGSPDRSGEIADEYARRYPERIRTIHQANRGLGGARYTGIEAARGEYLLFLDSDDTLSPGALEEMLQALDRDADILFFDYVCVDESGRVLSYQTGCSRQGPFSLAVCPQLVFELPSACNKLWRRSLFTEGGVRFPEKLWFEDLATSPRLYLRARQAEAVPRPWLRYLQRSGSITRAKDPSRNAEIVTALDLVLEDYRRQGAFDRYARELELLAVKHQLLAATVRVALADPRSPLLPQLLEDLDRKFPHWRESPYLSQLPIQHRLLLRLTDAHAYGAVRALMQLNDLVKRKRA
ncbi:MAG: glycosyltransferase [Oscillospiraceae bacterium]|nr:glycosyltransferase [Oscillospiraceae bacterium]